MKIRNCEFKARVEDLDSYERKLQELQPRFHGLDHQKDTYFNTKTGRLKLREGNIEHALIHYERENIAEAKESSIILYAHAPNAALKNILELQLGIKAVVDKKRKIYFIDHVKFHFDRVEGLGTFMEVEVIDVNGVYTWEELRKQCDWYQAFFQLTPQDLVDRSYSDLVMERMGSRDTGKRE